MSGSLAGKTVMVTGGSRGIGRAIAKSLAGERARVIVTGRSEEHLAETVRLIEDAGGRAIVEPCNLACADEVVALAARIAGHTPSLDVLVHNAGVSAAGPIEQSTVEQWDHCMAVNARAVYLLTRELLGLLERADRARVVMISSVVGVKGYANQTIYTATKHAMRGFAIALAEELRDRNIRVHTVCPGGVYTDMIRTTRPDLSGDDLIAPEEIAELVHYLVTHKGNAVVDELHVRRATSNPWF